MSAIFPAAAWTRLVVALGYAAAVAAAVWAVDWRGGAVPVAAQPPTRAAGLPVSRELHAEATFAVGRWLVLADGREVAGSGDGRSWKGTVAGAEVLIQAEAADPADPAPGALRVEVAGREVLAWGSGTVSAVVRPGGAR